ncbi:RNA polymerase sigma factor [Nesterenkonia halotolerans]|uniref:RNA polymerase sigma-70 factor (ECF subfamily) n=1 Tax=Nesterenkonia halotolerans TaxID=225325 RepID=A0ABR9J7G0_9MICC|nr:sigma-70 family RNA polymerase sigma factor [Nesterenkonia halotolerans]MBE1514918.1 RNA polymerase sigma-70 factor (ECF subfamily) [Nesterenkonia halotolerans]
MSRQAAGDAAPPPGADEVTLVARAQDGDLAAFEQLVDRYESRLLGLCIRMLHQNADAEDIVQDTFLTTWRRLDSLQDPAAFKAWIFRLASNGCLDFLRRKQVRRTDTVDPADMVEQSATGASVEHRAEASAAVDELDRVLATLPPEQRLVWLLYEVEGQSYAEIAEVLRLTEGSVRGRIHRARIAIVEGMKAWA